MKNVIQQLKDNEKPFGLMGEKMQAKAGKIGKYHNFQWWNSENEWEFVPNHGFTNSYTYRLRADYEDEPEIVECEIKRQFNDVYYIFTGKCPIYTATGDPDFIGLKFENWIWGMAYKNKHTGIISLMIRADQLDDYEVCDMTQAHVLFRRKKQE